MPSKLHISLVIALGLLCAGTASIQAAGNPATQQSRAVIVSPQDETTTYNVRDMGGRMVTVQVPSMASPDLKVSNEADGTVRATVKSIDGEKNQVKIQTQAGQMLVLTLAPETIAGMRVGDEFTLQVAQQSAQ